MEEDSDLGKSVEREKVLEKESVGRQYVMEGKMKGGGTVVGRKGARGKRKK